MFLFGLYRAEAAPLIWEADFGTELTQLTAKDDAVQHVALNFDFTFFGIDYAHLFVDTNGVITLGADGNLPYKPDLPDDFLNATAPLISPFWTDLSLRSHGSIFFNEFDDRAVITWNRVGSFQNLNASFTFQVQLYADGRIIFGYDGIAPTVTQLDEDWVVGLSRGFRIGKGTRANFSDGSLYRPTLSGTAYKFTLSGTTYEVFEEGRKPFNLDGGNLVFTPFLGKISVLAAPPPVIAPTAAPIPEPSTLLLLILGCGGLMGNYWRRRKKRR